VNRAAAVAARSPRSQPHLAAIVDEYWPGSHADQIVSRLNNGFELMWVPMKGSASVSTLYVNHRDGRKAAARQVRPDLHSSIEGALVAARDGPGLDGVVIVPERNKRSGRPVPLDARGHPDDLRRRYFDTVASYLEGSNLRVPVYLDKYLGNTWADAIHVYETSRRLGLPLMAGSSLPLTMRCPPATFAEGSKVTEAVVLSTGFGEAVLYHPLELVQAMIERRSGGETGVAHVTYVDQRGFAAAWRSENYWSHGLVEAALDAVPHVDADFLDYWAPTAVVRDEHGRLPAPTGLGEALVVEYVDGFRLSILMLSGYMLRRSAAFRVDGRAAPLVTWTPTGAKLPAVPMSGHLVPGPGEGKPQTWNFDHMSFFIDRFMATGIAPNPLERNLLTNGVMDAAMQSRSAEYERLATPHLHIEYQPTTLEDL
jgi:hypothetical protein